MAAFAAIFIVYPELDLSISSLFFDSAKGVFLYKDNFVLWIVKKSVSVILLSILLGAFLRILFVFFKKLNESEYRKPLIVILFIMLIPVFFVHFLAKDSYGRARPYELKEFGGSAYYTAPMQVSRECYADCSFPSGHSAAAFSIVVLALVFYGMSGKIILFSVLYGALVGFARVMVGDHFLSDVVFSAVIVYFSAWMLYVYLMCKNAIKVRA